MGMDLSELEEMYSDDPEIRKEFIRSLPITIKRGEYEDLVARCKRLCAALDAATGIGTYPAAIISGLNAYEKRSDFMEGWNACNLAFLEAIIPILKDGDWEGDDQQLLASKITEDGKLI